MRILRELSAVVLIVTVLALPLWAQVIPGSPFSGGISSGVSFPLLASNGSVTAPSYAFTSQTNSGLYVNGSASIDFVQGGSGGPDLLLSSTSGWFLRGGGASSAGTSSIQGMSSLSGNNSGGDITVFGGSPAGTGTAGRVLVDSTTWVQQAASRKVLAADYTNATASFTATLLSVSVISARKYSFSLSAFFSDSTAADGAQFDFNGGTATSTNFRAHCRAANNVGGALVLTNAATTALATAVQAALALTTQSWLECAGTFEPSSTGTFIVRAAQTAHTTGTLTVNRGSYLWVEDMP